MNYEKLTKKKLIELIRDLKRREWEYLEGQEKDYSKFLLQDYDKKQEELEIRNEQMEDIQHQLEESREKYVELYDNAPVGYLTLNDKGVIEDINKTGSLLLSIESPVLKNLPLNIYVAKESALEFLMYLNRCRHSLQQEESRFRLRNGKYVQAVTTPGNIRNKTTFMMILYDITEIKKAEDTNQFLASIVEHSKDAIYTRTIEGEITSWNNAAEKMYGYSVSEIIGKHITILYPDTLREEYQRVNSLLLADKWLEQFRTKHITKDERLIDISASFSLLSKDETGTGNLVVIARDITDQVAHEEQITKSLQEKELLLKEIHHRVKNNLQIISSLLNLQKTKSTDQEVHNLFNASQNRIRAMALVHERLYLSGDSARINLKDYITELSRHIYLSYPLQEKRVVYKQDVEDKIIEIDMAIDMGLIFNELMTNALKHAFNSKDNGEISVSITTEDKKVKLFFSDNGTGLPEDFINRKDSLGLTIITSLVEQNKGTLNINNNNGTEYIITLSR
jgi:PAS domain S-box-containing protein